ncbi:protein FRA10AC1 isoform X2 [Impatiens glandulifera]|uniref:protein FRA10AC1 isoform X2 n=1 Tax=Impatiens glandulifera TaxID=253017 RepID=UPI001FB17F74|nr:protein FRA10AC1 isoform X2 [Impatiens glandulifera]
MAASFGATRAEIFDREARKQQYQAHVQGLNAYDRHKKFLNDYVAFYGKEVSKQEKLPSKTDHDTLKEGYRFIRSEEDDLDPSWEQKLVKRYYNKLFKEYCIADMSHYKNGKIGLRWRTEKEVMSGKGQFVCGNKHCNDKDGLGSYEVNFCYVEAGQEKQALVKLVACERCAEKLVYKRRKEEELVRKREIELEKTRERLSSGEDSDSVSGGGNKERRKRENEKSQKKKKKRKRSNSDCDVKNDEEMAKLEKRSGGEKRASSTSARNKKEQDDDDDDFDYLFEGMFPPGDK